DIQLPGIDGWRVLDRLKGDLSTRHVPVYVITTEDDTGRERGAGALGLLTKPIKTKEALDSVFASLNAHLNRPSKDLLLVWPANSERDEIADLLNHSDVEIHPTSAVAEALGAMNGCAFDCIVVDTSGIPESELRVLPELIRQAGLCEIPVVL